MLHSLQCGLDESDDAALVEFAVYGPLDPRVIGSEEAEDTYIVYVLSKGHELQWKQLGTSREIDETVQAFRKALRDASSTDARSLGRKQSYPAYSHRGALLVPIIS